MDRLAENFLVAFASFNDLREIDMRRSMKALIAADEAMGQLTQVSNEAVEALLHDDVKHLTIAMVENIICVRDPIARVQPSRTEAVLLEVRRILLSGIGLAALPEAGREAILVSVRRHILQRFTKLVDARKEAERRRKVSADLCGND
ncbi:MAG: hypothetical protein HZA95_01405 [Candidatus Vogelbacteria bacterium]|nr:hypothetical protein [Candidatus Vogelbacteria bacterium]